MANTLPTGSTAITDPNNPQRQLAVNVDGSINTTTTVTPPANQRVNAQSGDFVDGAIATIGAQADTSATSDTGTFTLMALFKRLLTKFVYDNTDRLKVSLYGKNAAAGDTAILLDSTGRQLIGVSTATLYTLASTTTSGSTQNSGDLSVGAYREISIDLTTTAQAGTSPTIQYFYERKGADGIYYILWQSNVLTAAANTLSTSIGAGMAYNQSLGLTGRLRWVIGGSATPTFTHSLNIYAK